METQLTLAMMNDELGQARTSKKEFLNRIENIIPWTEFLKMIEPCYYKGERGNKPNVIKLTIIGKNTGVCSRDSGILLFNLGLERHDKQTDQKICLYRY